MDDKERLAADLADGYVPDYEREIRGLRAENERLRKALEEISESWGNTGEDAIDFKNTAKAALREVNGGNRDD